jgi:hypothetical protein
MNMAAANGTMNTHTVAASGVVPRTAFAHGE